MTDLLLSALRSTTPGAGARHSLPPLASRAVLLVAVMSSIVIGLQYGGMHAPSRADADLTRLLRFMAALKAGMALAVLFAVAWRLAAPVSPMRLVAYSLASGTMAAGPGMIWGMEHVGLGAVLLHGGLLASLLLLWLDPATSNRLRQMLEARSKRPGPGLPGARRRRSDQATRSSRRH